MCLKRAILFYLISVFSIVSFSSRLHFSCQEIYRVIQITRKIVQFLKNLEIFRQFLCEIDKAYFKPTAILSMQQATNE